jgi:hypothetical protein
MLPRGGAVAQPDRSRKAVLDERGTMEDPFAGHEKK